MVLEGLKWALPRHAASLASPDLAVAYDRQPVFRPRSWRFPSCQSCNPRPQYSPPVYVLNRIPGYILQRVRSRPVWAASAACRTCRLGCRPQGFAQRLFLYDDLVDVPPIPTKAEVEQCLYWYCVIRVFADGQIYVRYSSAHSTGNNYWPLNRFVGEKLEAAAGFIPTANKAKRQRRLREGGKSAKTKNRNLPPRHYGAELLPPIR